MFKKILMSCIISLASSIFSFAEASIIHNVARGETLESIAQSYGVTKEQIIEANPDAAQFIYVGMELTIPTSTQLPEPTTSQEVKDSSSFFTTPTPNTFKEPNPTSKDSYTPFDFSSFSVSYLADFDAAGKGHYMIGGSVINDSGWGADFHIGFNYGLVDKDFAGVLFLAGPAYGHVVENVLISSSLNFVGNYYGTGKGKKTGTNHKGEEYHYTGSDLKFGWGIALMPKITIMVGNVKPWIGVNATWTKGVDKLGIGFQIGLGFNI